MADIKKVFGVQFVLENTKSVLNDADKFIGQMERKVEKIDLTSEIKNEFSELTDYLNKNFKNGLNLSSQFSDIINSEDVNEAINKIKELLDNLKLVDSILSSGNRNDKLSRTKLSSLSTYQIDSVFQIAKDQKPNATANTRQSNLMREINDAYKKVDKTATKDLQSDVGQAVGMSKELEDVIKNIANDIKNIRSTINGFKQNGIKSTMAGITSEMVAQGEAGTNLNEVLLNLIASLGTYKETARGGINPSKNKSGKTDVPKTEKQEKKDDPIHDALQDYDELDKLLIRYSNKEGFFNTFKRHGKDIVSVIDKLRETKIALEDIEAEYPRLVAGYKLWVDIQNNKKDSTKKNISGLYEQKLNEEKNFYQENKEVGEGLKQEKNFKTIQDNYQLRINTLQGQIDEELSKALEEGLMTQAEVDQAKLDYKKKLEEATAEIDASIKNRLKNDPLLALRHYAEQEEKEFKKGDPKAYRKYRESIQTDVDETLQQLDKESLNSLNEKDKAKQFIKRTADNREAALIKNTVLDKIQANLTAKNKSPEEIKKAYLEASEAIIEAQQRLLELQEKGSTVAKNALQNKDYKLLFNQEDFFRKYVPRENQEQIDKVKEKLNKYNTQLQTKTMDKSGTFIEYNPLNVEAYQQKYNELRSKINKLKDELKTLGVSEEEISKFLANTALEEEAWIQRIKEVNEEKKESLEEEQKNKQKQNNQQRNQGTGTARDVANSYANTDYTQQRSVEDEDSYKTGIGDNSEQYSEENEQLNELIDTLERYKATLSSTNSAEEYETQFNELQKEIKETEQQYRDLYEVMKDSDSPIASWEEIQSNYFDSNKLSEAKQIKQQREQQQQRKEEWEKLKTRMDEAEKEDKNDSVKAWERYNEQVRKEAERKNQAGQNILQASENHVQALEKEKEARVEASEASSQVDTSKEVSETNESIEVLDKETEALNNNTEARENNQRVREKSNIIITTGNSQSQSNSFTMSDEDIINTDDTTLDIGAVKEKIVESMTKSNAKYEVDITDIVKIKTDGLEGIALKIARDLNTAIGKYSKLTGLIPINEEAMAEVEEYKKAQEQIKNFPNVIKDMKFNNLFPKDKKGNLITDDKIRKISFDDLSKMKKDEQQLIFEDKIISLYDEALNLSEKINNDKGNKAQIEKAREKLNILKEQMVALLSEFTEIGNISREEIIDGKKVKININPLEHLKNQFSNKTKQTHGDISTEEMSSIIEDFTQWLQPFIDEKNAIWDIGNNIKAEGKKIVDKNGRPIKVFDANARSNYKQAKNLGENIQKYFNGSVMQNGNLQFTSEELRQLANLLPESPKDNKYLKESVNSQEVFSKIQQIVANAIQRNIDILTAQLDNGEDVELPLRASKIALAQLQKSMGITIEKPKPVSTPIIQPTSTVQQESSTPVIQQSKDNVGQIASETSEGLNREKEQAELVGISFQNAALAKQAFTEANKEAKVSAEETAVAIGEETDEAEQVANEFDIVAEKTKEAVSELTSENQKSLTPEEILGNPSNLIEQIEKITQGKFKSAQELGKDYYDGISILVKDIEKISFNGLKDEMSSSLEVQTDTLLKLLSQVGVIGSDGYNQIIDTMRELQESITETDNKAKELNKTFNNTKITGISKLSETQLMGKADNSLMEMGRLYNENREGTDEFLLEQLKVKQVLDEIIKRSGGRSKMGFDTDLEAYKSILKQWNLDKSLISDENSISLFSKYFGNISDNGKTLGAKKAIERWVQPEDYQNALLLGQQLGIILNYITQNQEALKVVHDQLKANLPVIEETADEMKEVTENAEHASEVVDKVIDKTETLTQEESKPSPTITANNPQRKTNRFSQLTDEEILERYKENQKDREKIENYSRNAGISALSNEEILSGNFLRKHGYIQLREENAELEEIIKERGLLNEELKEEVTETKNIIEEEKSVEEKPKNPIEEKWERAKKKFGIETPDYSKLSDEELQSEYEKMSRKMNVQGNFINRNNSNINAFKMSDEELLSDDLKVLGKEKFIEFRRNTEELKRLIEERKTVNEEHEQVVEETKEELKKDEEIVSSPAPTSPVKNITPQKEDYSKKTDEEILALSKQKKERMEEIIHLNLAQRIDMASMTDEEISSNSSIMNKDIYLRLKKENEELNKIIEERKTLGKKLKDTETEIGDSQRDVESQDIPKDIINKGDTGTIDEASDSAQNLRQNLDEVADSLNRIEEKKEQLGQTVEGVENSVQPLTPEQVSNTTSELENTKNRVVELEQQIKDLQSQAQKFDFGDKALETLKEFEKILKAISESLKDIDAKWKGIYATNASDFKKAVVGESQKSDTKSDNSTKNTNDIVKDEFKSDLIALTNKNSKTGIYGRNSLRMKDQANKLSDPKDIDNLEKADALFDKIAKRIQNLKKSKSLSTILDDPEIKALLEERKSQIDYVRRSKLRKNTNEDILNQNKNALKLEQAYKSATELAPEAYRIEDLIVNGTASDKDFKKFNDFVRAKNYIESEEGQKTQSLINPDSIKNYETAISFSEQRQEALRKEKEELEKKAEAEKRAQEYESLKNRMDKAELDDEWDAKRSIENYKQQRKKEDAKRTTDLWTRMNKAEADDELDAQTSIERYKQQRKKEDEIRTKQLWARMDAEEEYENQSYKQSQENYKKQLEYSKKVQQEEKNKIKNEQTKEAQSVKDGQDLIKVYEQLYNSYYKYQQLKNKQNDGVLSSAELKQVQDLETELDKLNAKLLEFANSKPELWNQKNVVDAEEAFKNNILNIDSIGNGDKVKQIVGAYDKRFSAEDKIRSLTVQQAGNYNANRAKQIADLEAKVKEYTQIINENTEALKNNNDAVALNIVNSAKQQYNQKTESSTNVLNESINTDRINKAKSTLASLEELRSEYSSGDYTNQQELLNAIETRINNINQLIKDLNANPLDLTTEEDLDALTQIDKELSNYKKDIADIKKDSKDYQTANGSKTARSIAEFMAKNSGISQEAKDALQQYINLIDKGVNVGQLREIGASFEDIKRQEIEAGRTGTTFFDMLGQRVKGLTATLMTYVSFWRIFSELKQGFQIIHQFDDALAEMQKVSNETLGTLKEFQTTTFDLADSIGSDALALQQSVAEFMRLGQSLEEATDSAKSASILLNVSEFTNASEASQALIAMSQAYQDLNNIEIIDVLNKLGNDFPISTQGLATALQDGAASLTTAGNSFYEAAALVTAGNRITQDPSKVGKAMRTIALRLTGTEASKAELEEDGEEVEGMITNVSKLRDTIMQATKVSSNGFKGFDILKDNGAYKSTYEILLGIAEIYDEIVENDKKTGAKGANLLLETIAGKNRASVAASILQSPDMLKEAYAEAIDAEGSAEIENAKYIDSISGHLEKLKNAWQEVWANTLNRDVINFFLDLGTAILKVVSNIGLIPSLLIAGGGIATLYEFAKNGGLIVQGLHALNDALTANTIIKEANTIATEQETKANIENVGSQVAETTADAADTAQTMTQAAATEANVAATKQETAENLKNAASQGIKEGSKKTSIGANLATNFNLLKETTSSAFAAIGGIKGILGGGLVIGGIVAAIQAYDALNISASETAKEAKEISSAFEESLGTIREHKDAINELSESYQNLSQGVNTSTNTNLTLSNDEYKEYLDTCNKIAEIYPQLVTGYDLQGNAIVNLTGNVKSLRDALIEEQKVAANTFLQGGEKKGIGGFFDNLFGFFGLGNKNSIKDNFNNNYDKYNDIQTIQDQFLNKNNVSLDDYTLFRTDLLGKSLDGDIDATNLLNTLDEISNGLVDSDEQLSIFLNDLSKLNMPKEMQQSMKEGQQTLLSKLSLNDSYWDLIYNDNEDISKSASNIFTNVVNGLSPEQLREVLKDEDSLNSYIDNLVNGVDNLFNKTSQNTFNWSEILDNNGLKKATDEYTKSMNQLKQLGYSSDDISSMVDSGKVGNVNLNTDRAIQWNEDNLNKYISQLRGWNEGLSDEEIKKKFKNGTSTVFGSGETFNFGKGTIDLSFATITEDGRLLDIDELYDYIQTILTRAEHSGEPLTIDTVLKFDAQGVTDKNGNIIKNMIAGEGFNASEAMHEVELLKGFGDTKGWTEVLGEYKTKYGDFVDEILSSSGEIQNQIKNIGSFQDILNDLNDFSIGEGILANANMGDFSKIANLYKQAFIEAFADSDIDGAEVFEEMFDDKGISELQARFTDVLNSSFTALDSNSRNQAIEFFNSLSKEQAQTYIESFNGAKDLSQVTENYNNKLRALSANTYEAVVNIEDETAAVNTLTSALSSSASGTGLSSEEVTNITSLFSDLASYDEDALIERTANGIHLNVEELEKLNKERAEINLKKQGKELDKYNKELDESEKNLKDLKARYDANKMSLEEYQSAYSEENNIKNGILDKINLLEREMAQYSALTSAYNKYVQAQSSANENARYENIAGGYETTKDLIERGWIGQDDVRAYLNMFTNDDMMTASVQELYDVWDKLDDKINSAGYSAKDFFTFDENNKSTSDGIFNFLDTVRQAAKDSGISDAILDQLVAVDEATGTYSFDFDILGGDQKIADMLGMDLSLLQAIIQAARDAGFEVQMTNALPGVQALTENLRNMRAEVKKLGGDVDKYDFHVLSVDVSDDSSEYTSVLDSISGAIKELKEANLDDPLNFAYYNQVNSELETLIGTKARATVDKGWEGTNIDQVAPKYQSLVAILDEMYYQQQRLEETNAFNKQYQLDVDTSSAQKALNAVQDDLKKYIGDLSYADAQELGLNVTPDFDQFTAEEKWDAIKEQIEEQGGVKIPVDLENPTGDPTKGIDSQKITIDVQFSVDGNTLVLKDITSVTKAAENVPEKVNTELSTTGDGAEKTNSFVSDLDKVPPEVKTALKVQEDKKKVAQYKATLDKVPPSVKTQMLLTGTSALDNYLTKINNNKNKSIWVDIKARWDKSGLNGMPSSVASKLGGVWGTANVSGTAFVRGTAYAKGTSGDWGVPDDQDALVGELGEELIVRNGHFFTVGSESAEMVHLQRGDIIFNADQTRQIFEKGRIANGLRRGKAHADGTAYSAGSGGRRRTNAVVSSSNSGGGSSSGGGGNNKSSGNKSSNNEAEKMDWIAIAIERIEQQIDELNDVVDSVYRSWSDRNEALSKEIKAVSDEIAIQQAGYKRYLKEAESIGLSEKYAKKVREGTIDIEKITDEKLKKKIDEYQQWCVLRPLIW